MTYDKETINKMYLDYVNNFLTVDKFAEHYGIRLGTAKMIIKVGSGQLNNNVTFQVI